MAITFNNAQNNKRQLHIMEANNGGFVVNEIDGGNMMRDTLLAAVSGPHDLIEFIANEYSVDLKTPLPDSAPPTWTPTEAHIWPFVEGTEIAVIWKTGEQTNPQPYEVFERNWKEIAFFRITKGAFPFQPPVVKGE